MSIALAARNQLSSFRSESSVKLHYTPKDFMEAFR
jgi:hypothetical protein